MARTGGGTDAIDVREDVTDLVVRATRVTGGVVDLPHSLELVRA